MTPETPTPKPLPPQPIVPNALRLFRPEARFLRQLPESCLPFVSGVHDGKTKYWDVPEEPLFLENEADRRAQSLEQRREDDAALGRAYELGARSAAAYVIFVMKNGAEDFSLEHVVSAMKDSPRSRTAQSSFWYYLTRILHLYSFSLSAAQVADDVEAYLADAKQYDEIIE